MESSTDKPSAAATGEALVKDVHQLKKDVAKLTADVKAHGQASVDDVKQRVTDAIEKAKAELVSHPFAILGFGVVLGFLFGRRSHRRRSD